MGHWIGGCRGEMGLTCVIERTPLGSVEQGEIGLTCVIKKHTPLGGVSRVDGRGKDYTERQDSL